jgi:hypothetical protein
LAPRPSYAGHNQGFNDAKNRDRLEHICHHQLSILALSICSLHLRICPHRFDGPQFSFKPHCGHSLDRFDRSESALRARFDLAI